MGVSVFFYINIFIYSKINNWVNWLFYKVSMFVNRCIWRGFLNIRRYVFFIDRVSCCIFIYGFYDFNLFIWLFFEIYRNYLE